MSELDVDFYRRADPVQIARDLLGKLLTVSAPDGQTVSGWIVETEAYSHLNDRACHAYNKRRTRRNATMFRPGGVAYVYLCYGIHPLLNFVTNDEDMPDAVLIRALEPAEGMEQALLRRKLNQKKIRDLMSGPGKLTQALGVDLSFDGRSLYVKEINVRDEGRMVEADCIVSSPRVGVGYAGDDSMLPWRFRVKDSLWTSPAK